MFKIEFYKPPGVSWSVKWSHVPRIEETIYLEDGKLFGLVHSVTWFSEFEVRVVLR